MVGALKEVVVKELVRLKVGCADFSRAVTQCSWQEEQTRIRMGLKENMKHANEVRLFPLVQTLDAVVRDEAHTLEIRRSCEKSITKVETDILAEMPGTGRPPKTRARHCDASEIARRFADIAQLDTSARASQYRNMDGRWRIASLPAFFHPGFTSGV